MLDKNAELDAVYRASGLVHWHIWSIKLRSVWGNFMSVVEGLAAIIGDWQNNCR
jgi:hypothetical protein